MLLHGVVSANAMHRRLRVELLSSHPDKFPGRWRARLAACGVESVMVVKETSQALTNIMGWGKPAAGLFIVKLA